MTCTSRERGLFLERFIRKCYDIYSPGTAQHFHGSRKRTLYFLAWQRAIALQIDCLTPMEDKRAQMRAQANFESYCEKERAILS